jgi:DNA gyrase subunit B
MGSQDAKSTSSNRGMKRLKDEAQVRERPGVIFGTNDEHGAFHGVFEVVANSIDEAREGHGKSIRITVEKDNVITVEDDGRGLPMGWNESEQTYDWVLALCTLYASGKYDNEQYTQSLGLNGLGLTAMQYASSFMDVWSTYDNQTHYMHFEKGKPIGDMKVTKAEREGTGTKIKFQPDPDVFPILRHKELTADMFLTELRRQAMLLSKLEIILDYYTLSKPVRFYYENGIAEYIDSITEKPMLPKTVEFTDSAVGTDDTQFNSDPYKLNMRVAFNFGRSGNAGEDAGLTEIYHNASILFEGGTTASGFEKGIVGAFTDYAKSLGKIGKNERFVYKDISSILFCVMTTDAPGNRTWFKNQTKGAVTNPFMGDAVTQFIYNKFRYWLENNTTVSNKVVTEVVTNKTAREEGAEVSKKVINNLSKTVSFGNKPKDFRDCSSKNVREREVYIVEGRSALGSVKLACNPKFQAVMPVRGKIINCLKEKLTRVLNNSIIIDLYRVLGCGMEAKSEYIQDLPKFDINKLNWGKVIICTDADVDGEHIRCLLITMFFILSPSLLKAGKVYIAETPLYEITYKKDTKFAYNDAEKDKILAEFAALGIKDSQIKIQRSKGLGENDPEMMAISTMNPETRRLVKVEYPENEEDLMTYFNALLGDDLETRRILIEEYFDIVDGTD